MESNAITVLIIIDALFLFLIVMMMKEITRLRKMVAILDRLYEEALPEVLSNHKNALEEFKIKLNEIIDVVNGEGNHGTERGAG